MHKSVFVRFSCSNNDLQTQGSFSFILHADYWLAVFGFSNGLKARTKKKQRQKNDPSYTQLFPWQKGKKNIVKTLPWLLQPLPGTQSHSHMVLATWPSQMSVGWGGWKSSEQWCHPHQIEPLCSTTDHLLAPRDSKTRLTGLDDLIRRQVSLLSIWK